MHVCSSNDICSSSGIIIISNNGNSIGSRNSAVLTDIAISTNYIIEPGKFHLRGEVRGHRQLLLFHIF